MKPLSQSNTPRVFVIVPCYKVRAQILDLVAGIGPEVERIILVDDACPEKSGEYARDSVTDARLEVLFNEVNLGVGGAVVTGIQYALDNNAEIVVKLDGDGQYDPELIPLLISPIAEGSADCAKGNRFYNLDNLAEMPTVRVIGNAMLSFINKFVSGYWDIMDPTNGLVAIHANILRQLPLDKLDKRYFFESDLLFRLGTARAVICDIPLQALYRDETSSLSIFDVSLEFPMKYINRSLKRLFYSYFLRDFNMGSVSLLAAAFLITSGLVYGSSKWLSGLETGIPATPGMVMISGLQLLLGFNFLISFINYDIGNVPRRVQFKLLQMRPRLKEELARDNAPEDF